MMKPNFIVFSVSLIILMTVLEKQSQAQGHSHANELTKKEKKMGWKLLFDGTTFSGWKGAFIEGFPSRGWVIEDGVLIVQPSGGKESTNGGDIITINDYSNFELSIDFKLTEGANSGIKYFVDPNQPKPADPRSAIGLEYQLLDDRRHPDAKLGKNGNRTLSSLYDLIPARLDKPAKPIGQWNTARIISQGQHVEHWLNGIKVLEYERGGSLFAQSVSDSKFKALPNFGLLQKGRILLQDHGNKVFFKNIKIREFSLAKLSSFGKTLTEIPGIVSYTYRNSFKQNVAATLDTIKTLGITNIEFSNLFGKTALEIRKLLDLKGMRCTSFGVSYSDLLNSTTQVGENAKTLGCSYVRVAWIPHDKIPFSIEITKQAVNVFNAAGKILKQQFGLAFCYHNHGYEFQPYGEGTFFDYIVANTDPEYVNFELDIFWAVHPGKDPIQLLKKYGSRFKLMHIKDLRKGVVGDFSGGTSVENDVAVGTGQIDVAGILKAAKRSAIMNYYIEDESSHVKSQVPISLAYLKSL